MVTMFGWSIGGSPCPARRKRASRSGSCATSGGSSLSATSRPSLVSVARYTSPIPPAPSDDLISYGPSFVPGRSGMSSCDCELGGDYKVPRGGRQRSHTERLSGKDNAEALREQRLAEKVRQSRERMIR